MVQACCVCVHIAVAEDGGGWDCLDGALNTVYRVAPGEIGVVGAYFHGVKANGGRSEQLAVGCAHGIFDHHVFGCAGVAHGWLVFHHRATVGDGGISGGGAGQAATHLHAGLRDACLKLIGHGGARLVAHRPYNAAGDARDGPGVVEAVEAEFRTGAVDLIGGAGLHVEGVGAVIFLCRRDAVVVRQGYVVLQDVERLAGIEHDGHVDGAIVHWGDKIYGAAGAAAVRPVSVGGGHKAFGQAVALGGGKRITS